jgi:hypothetical protein
VSTALFLAFIACTAIIYTTSGISTLLLAWAIFLLGCAHGARQK